SGMPTGWSGSKRRNSVSSTVTPVSFRRSSVSRRTGPSLTLSYGGVAPPAVDVVRGGAPARRGGQPDADGPKAGGRRHADQLGWRGVQHGEVGEGDLAPIASGHHEESGAPAASPAAARRCPARPG